MDLSFRELLFDGSVSEGGRRRGILLSIRLMGGSYDPEVYQYTSYLYSISTGCSASLSVAITMDCTQDSELDLLDRSVRVSGLTSG